MKAIRVGETFKYNDKVYEAKKATCFCANDEGECAFYKDDSCEIVDVGVQCNKIIFIEK